MPSPIRVSFHTHSLLSLLPHSEPLPIDIVFFIFLYQRWIYRVDPKRINEYGTSGEDSQGAPVGEERENGPSQPRIDASGNKKTD